MLVINVLLLTSGFAPRRAPSDVARSRVARARAPRASLVAMASKAEVNKELIVPVPAPHLYNMLANFSRYEQIWPGEYQAVKVLAHRKAEFGWKESTTVEFSHRPIMGFAMRYALDIEGVSGKSVLWELNSSTLIDSNIGGWRLHDLGDGSTRVSYGCNVELNANVPGFMTEFILGQAFPKMLRQFSTSATAEWAILQAEKRARFERPLQAAAGSVNATIRLFETAAESALSATKLLTNARVSEISQVVDNTLEGLKRTVAQLRESEILSELVENPALGTKIDENVQQMEDLAVSIKLLVNGRATELSSRIDGILSALEIAAQNSASLAEELALQTASQLAEMSTGSYGINATSLPTVDFTATTNVSGTKPAISLAEAPKVQRAVASGWAAFANSCLNVLERFVPGDRPEIRPASKRQRLGNLLGLEWNISTPSAAQLPLASKEIEER